MSIPTPNNSDLTITIVDCKHSYRDAAKKHYKQLPLNTIIDELTPNKVISNYSRFEILNNKYCRIYFDIECIPKDKPNIIHTLINDLNTYMKSIHLITTDFKYALTFNPESANHKGLSYHLILYEYSMDHITNKNLVMAFIHSDYGKDYINYIDCSVYSKPHLFKLPYYIGMTKHGIDTNINNYHRIITGEPIHCIIQYIHNTKQLTHEFITNHKQIPTNISRNTNKKTLKLHNKIITGIKLLDLTVSDKKTLILKHKAETIIQNINKLTNIKQKLANRINTKIDKDIIDTLYNIIQSKLSKHSKP